jgi:hypothetical protein
VLPTDSNVEAAARSLTAGSHPVERDGVAAIARDPWGTRLRLRAHHS